MGQLGIGGHQKHIVVLMQLCTSTDCDYFQSEEQEEEERKKEKEEKKKKTAIYTRKLIS